MENSIALLEDKIAESIDLNHERKSKILDLWVGEAYYAIGFKHIRIDDYRKAILSFEKSVKFLEKNYDRYLLARVYFALSSSYRAIFDLSNAINQASKFLKVSQNIGYKEYIAEALLLLGEENLYFGKLDTANSHFRELITVYGKDSLSKWNLRGEIGFGYVELNRGNLLKAEKYYLKAKSIYDKSSDVPISTAFLVIWHLGRVYTQMAKFSRAKQYLHDALKLTESENLNRSASSFYSTLAFQFLIEISLAEKDSKLANKYLDKIEKNIRSSNSDLWHQVLYDFSKIEILMTKLTLKDKFQAMELLEKLVDEDLDAEFRDIALIHFTNLLLDELKFYGNPDVLNRIKDLLIKIDSLASSQRSYSMVVKLTLLQSKFAVIEGNFDGAVKLLIDIRKVAEKKGMKLQLMRIDEVREELDNLLIISQNLVKSSGTIADEIKKAKLQDYLSHAIKVINEEVFEN